MLCFQRISSKSEFVGRKSLHSSKLRRSIHFWVLLMGTLPTKPPSRSGRLVGTCFWVGFMTLKAISKLVLGPEAIKPSSSTNTISTRMTSSQLSDSCYYDFGSESPVHQLIKQFPIRLGNCGLYVRRNCSWR